MCVPTRRASEKRKRQRQRQQQQTTATAAAEVCVRGATLHQAIVGQLGLAWAEAQLAYVLNLGHTALNCSIRWSRLEDHFFGSAMHGKCLGQAIAADISLCLRELFGKLGR